MNAIVIEHVKVSELPAAWRQKLDGADDTRVTVRIEQEVPESTQPAVNKENDDPLFGMWRDREDMSDVQAYVRKLRAPRF